MEKEGKISYEDFKRIKFDTKFRCSLILELEMNECVDQCFVKAAVPL